MSDETSKNLLEQNQKNKNKKPPKEYDIYKDSYLRYLGYSNEIGEAFRKVTSRGFVLFTYLLEFGYFAGDTFHKGHKAYHNAECHDNRYKHVIRHSGYTILWQFFATCLIPPLAINIVVGRMHNFLTKRNYSVNMIRYTPMTIGLIMIPLFNIYIDPIVGHALDHVFDNHI